MIIKNMEKKNIPTHDPYTGELNPFYEELTGEENPLKVNNDYEKINFKIPRYSFFDKKAENLLQKKYAGTDYFNHKNTFMDGVRMVMKEILTKDEYDKFINR